MKKILFLFLVVILHSMYLRNVAFTLTIKMGATESKDITSHRSLV